MADRHILYKLLPLLAGSRIANAEDIELDTTAFSGNLDADDNDVQELAGAVDNLSVSGGANPNRFGGPIVPFTGSVTINAGNYNTYVDSIALYVRSDNALVNFNLPSDAVIAGRYPVAISILHQGGTARDAGTTFNPLNRVRVPEPAGEELQQPLGRDVQFVDVRQNDFVTFTKQSDDAPWIGTVATLTTGALLLPDGVFNLKPETVRFNPTLQGILGIPVGFVPQAGDAYRVGNDSDTFGGFGVQTDDVIVALIDAPSRLNSPDNDDWLVIRNVTNGTVTLQELRFLNQVTEVDSFSDSRLMDRSDVNDVRLFLSPFILDHAPFINPSTDPDNPQDGETGEYIGGDEADTATHEFEASAQQLQDFTGEAGASIAPNAFVYVDIDGSFDQVTELANVFVVIRDREGAEVTRLNLSDDFRPITLTGSTDTYYVYDAIGAPDNFSSINYISGYTIDVVHRDVTRQFNLGSAVNVITSIGDGEIPIEKLEPNAQALLQADHSLTDAQEAKLDGLQATGTATVWTAGELLAKLSNDASPSNDINSYHDVGQQNGLLGQFDRTTDYTFLVPNFVTVTGLERVDDNSVKVNVTPIGTILGRQAFTATLPASTFDINNPVGDAWRVDGTASNLELTGADDSFKIHQGNLDQELHDVINRPQVQPSQLPAVLETLSHDVTITTTTATEWRELPRPHSNTPELTRQFAFGWDENRRNFTGNYFDDLTGVEFVGFTSNNIFYYPDANDPLNTAFPGAQSYILNDNVRARNETGENTISDSFRKIIGFDYALQRALTDSDNFSMLRIGSASATPLIGLSREEGLYLNIGRGDGGTRTRDIVRNLGVLGNGSVSYGFGTVGGLPTSGEAPFVSPNPNDPLVTYPITLTVKIRLDNNGNDEGTFEHTYVITNVNNDQAETTFTATHTVAGVTRSFQWGIRYDANVNHATFGVQNVIFIRDVNPETNPALTDYVSIEYTVTESYNVPATYARQPINAGNGHDDFGLFDPTRYNTEHIEERNRVMLLLQQWEITDTSADPELAVRVIVDGQKEGSNNNGYLIRLHRTASEFTFNDMSFGNNICAVSHIQCYDYDGGHLIGEDSLLDYYNAAASWLGFYSHPTEQTDTIAFNGQVEILAASDGTARGLVMTDVTTGNRRLIEIDNGTLTNKDA